MHEWIGENRMGNKWEWWKWYEHREEKGLSNFRIKKCK